jgi:hypothetical protein
MARLFFIAGEQHRLIKQDQNWQNWWDSWITKRKLGSPVIDADHQRYATIVQQLNIIKAIRNGSFDENYMRKLVPNPDAALTFYNKFVAALPGREGILSDIERLLLLDIEKYQWTPQNLTMSGYDPQTKLCAPYVTHFVTEKELSDCEVIVPDGMINHPISDPNIGAKIFVYPNPSESVVTKFTQLAQDKIQPVLRTERMNRVFLAPVISNYFISNLLERTDLQHIRSVGRQIIKETYPEDNNLIDVQSAFYFAAEGAHAIAHTKPISASAFDVPIFGQHRFTALLAPEMSGLTQKPCGLILPDYNYRSLFKSQFKENAAIRLREMDHKGEQPSGWEVETHLTDHHVTTYQEFIKKCRSGEYDNQFAFDYGFAGLDHMQREISDGFTSIQKKLADKSNKILMIRFAPIDRKTMVYKPNPSIPLMAKMI